MEKNENKSKANCNDDFVNDFLQAAISDLAGNLNLLDTKISIVMATVGVILGLVVACKNNILRAYYFYSNYNFLKTVFLFLSITYVIFVIATFICGIHCIKIRFGKSKSPSLWFFDTEEYGGKSEQDYYRKVKNATKEDIKKNLSTEVYNLNLINNHKMRAGRATIILFSASCFVLFMLMIMVGIQYLVI